MAKGFSLEIDPWVYRAKFGEDGRWTEEYIEQPHRTTAEEKALGADERAALLLRRNNFSDLPLVNYTTQYGMGCFEGLKAFPQPDGSLKLFRPDENGKRMEASMKGLLMPGFPAAMFTTAVCTVVGKNKSIGFAPAYDPSWVADDFVSGMAVYIRPFSYAEPGIGVGISAHPWVIIVTTPIGSYFKPGSSKAVTTHGACGPTPAARAGSSPTPTTSRAPSPSGRRRTTGFMEAVFLDAKEQKYFEEGSSSNIFFVLKDGTVVTPSLEDTILPGITRKSVLVLAREKGLKTEERRISVKEAFSKGAECFVAGTAAGITSIESLTHDGKEAVFCNREPGEVTRSLLKTLKGIQYGAVPDTQGWMVPAQG